ncbi:hypothetical protein ABW20_dc0106085 [Dactylellina cionopaga]|nr:hypothetical protein ABW20_dc0106085 [Dactylellina cionopaga]
MKAQAIFVALFLASASSAAPVFSNFGLGSIADGAITAPGEGTGATIPGTNVLTPGSGARPNIPVNPVGFPNTASGVRNPNLGPIQVAP